MQYTIPGDSRSPPEAGGVVTRAQGDAQNNTAQPALTSGFGAVIEKEHDLQSATEDSVGHVSGRHAGEIDRILRHQDGRLGANIALLEQRYGGLPKPDRFVNWNDRRHPPTATRRTEQRDQTELLLDLIARHYALLGDIETLIGCTPDGQRGELILTEVGRNHGEMAWMLTALLKEDQTRHRFPNEESEGAAEGTSRAQENGDTENDSARPDSAAG